VQEPGRAGCCRGSEEDLINVSDEWQAQREALGAYIRTQREAVNVSYRQLARRTGLTSNYLFRVEQGLHQPSRRVLSLIAAALDIPAGTLLATAGLTGAPAENAGQVVREYRLARGLHQADVAAELGTTQHYVSMMEGGHGVPLKRRRQLAAILGIPPAMLGLADPPGDSPRAPARDPGLRRRAAELEAELAFVTRLLTADSQSPGNIMSSREGTGTAAAPIDDARQSPPLLPERARP